MKALVVGCGYVGAALGAELVRQGHEVYGLRRGLGEQHVLKSTGILPVCADITRRETLEPLPSGFDWVVNCVSAGGGGPEEYRRTYVEGNRNLVEWLAGMGLKKFVYTSSTGVYGQIDGSLVDESSVTAPESETGQVLVAAERVLLDAAEQEFPAVILRLAGIYGPGRGYWLRQFLAGKARLEGDGARFLNMVHRDDAVGAIVAALIRGRTGQIYNAVDDEPVSQLEMFKWLAARFGRSLPPPVSGEAATNPKRGFSDKRVSNLRLRRELAYQFKYPTFREGFAAELG